MASSGIERIQELEEELDYAFEFTLCYWCYRDEIALWKEYTRTKEVECLLELVRRLVHKLPECLQEGDSE